MYDGGAISWRSNQQSIAALSTSEAEYMSLSDAAKEAGSLLKPNHSLDTKNENKIIIYEDNRGAEKWTRTLSEPNLLQNRTKHIDISYHHTRDCMGETRSFRNSASRGAPAARRCAHQGPSLSSA